ncbi:hypothetical protein OSTOST_04232, partial [Ostertagia ostertagi]
MKERNPVYMEPAQHEEMPILNRESSLPREGAVSPMLEHPRHLLDRRLHVDPRHIHIISTLPRYHNEWSPSVSLKEVASTSRPGAVASPVARPIASTCGSPRLVETTSRPAAAARADTHRIVIWIDVALGVSLYAPGAAIAGVPRYTRKSAEMMNGTNTSSPNTTGAIACMLSKLRSENIQRTPYRVRLALENTAAGSVNEEAFGGGYGLVQVKSSIPDNTGTFDLAMEISLQSEGELLEFPRTFLLTAGEGHFVVKVDPAAFSRGEFAYTRNIRHRDIMAEEICNSDLFQRSWRWEGDGDGGTMRREAFRKIVGLCEDNHDLGPPFRVPITVISPEEVSSENDC